MTELDRWWTKPNGWETRGIQTQMRRCGRCKVDIVGDEQADRERGLCAKCLPRPKKEVSNARKG